MKKEWRRKLGSILLCVALLVGNVSSDAYAAEALKDRAEEVSVTAETELESGQEAADEETDDEALDGESKKDAEAEAGDTPKTDGETEPGDAPETDGEAKPGDEPGKDLEAASDNNPGDASKKDGGTASHNNPEQVSENDLETASHNNPDEVSENDLETVSDNKPEEEQYHLIEEDPDSVAKWLSLYCPNGFEDLLEQSEKWWDNLYDNEREYAEFLVGLIVELSEDVYDGQSLSECIKILESGVDADSFFKGTIFRGLTLEDLRALRAADGPFEELTEGEIREILGEERDWKVSTGAEYAGKGAETKARQAVGKSRAVSLAAEEEEVEEVEVVLKSQIARVNVRGTGYSGTGHGRIYRIQLGGVPALCISCGKHCRNSFLYNADPEDYERKMGALGFFAKNANNSGAEYVACQIAAWMFLENENLTEVQVKSRAQAMVNITSEISVRRMREYVWTFYRGAKSNGGTYYAYSSDNANSQILITFERVGSEWIEIPLGKPTTPPDKPKEPEEPKTTTLSQAVEVSYYMQVNKSDWQTGVGLEGCEVKLFENGTYLTTVTTDAQGRAEYSVQKTAVFTADYDGENVSEQAAWASLEAQIAAFAATPYTYSTKEVTAPDGYVWEANEESVTITGEETAEFKLTNERTLGAVELIKYDTESESGTSQGDATLDGAVYGIYAAQDIYHQDQKTGRIFKAGQLVQTAVTGKSPKRNADGYLLNTDGSRHIAQQGKEIAYVNTPGKTLFGDLELGSYYIKEITPSEGYMFDETTYFATFTYKDQMVKVEKRDETAGEAGNELTVDDDSSSDAVYSGDYVNKQGVQFLKTSDNAWQTELEPIEGAGFSAYLISGLSGVKSGAITPIAETWSADDVQTFYDYDFTDEKRAVIYKRTGHEKWLSSDTAWLERGAGKNEYRVKEMFTDKDGRIETPELPYGTYVIVETSTPEHHKSARPFIVSITRDGGVLYTDERKRKIEKAYDDEERIRYGDHEETREREGRVLQKQRIVNNMITKTHLRILKADEEFTVRAGAYISAEEFVRGTVLKEGAKYRLKCATLPFSRDSLLALNWKFDGDGYLSFYDQDARELVGTRAKPFTTHFLRKNGRIKDCYVMLPQEIPVGTYELEEMQAPTGYVVNGWEQFVQDNSTDRVNRYEIVDTPFPRAIFTIDNGAVYPDGQMGTNKYALTDEYGNLTVTVLQENQEQKGIVEITKHGEQLSGFGEASETLLDKLDAGAFRSIKKAPESAHRDLVFTYEDAPVEGAVFEIVADEDIYTQEVQRNLFDSYQAKKEPYLLHRKGDVVASVTTDRNGWGYAADLYIGKYKIVETTAGDGFVLNRTETAFEITPKEQTVNFDIHTADYKNERQKLEIAVKKEDRESGEPLSGAVYGLYAKEDILIRIERKTNGGKWVLKDEPETLCEAGTLIATCVTDESGKGIFDADLPLGKYYVRELEAPAGYLTASDDISVNGSYNSVKGGQDVERQEHCPTFRNRKTQALIAKRDLIDGGEIAGATFEIKEIETDLDGALKEDAAGGYLAKPVASWVSKEEEPHLFYRNVWGYLEELEEKEKLPAGRELLQKNAHLVTGLELEKAYLLSEKEAPDGYGYASDILFRLSQEREDGKLTGVTELYVMEDGAWRKSEEDVLAMYDEKNALEIEKSTIQMTQQGDTYQYTIEKLKNLTGASLEVFTVTDYLPEGLYLEELWTGTYSESLLYDVEYRTDRDESWISWADGLSTEEDHHLRIPDELRTKEEHIAAFRMCFGTVGGDFEKVESPAYMTYVSHEAKDIIRNEIELTAQSNGRKLKDRDETKTFLYSKWLAGYLANGGKTPFYEIVDNPVEEAEQEPQVIRSTIYRMVERAGEGEKTETKRNEPQTETEEPGRPQRLEDDDVPLAGPRRKVVRTGDEAPILFFTQTALFALAGIAILGLFGRKKKR